MIRVIIGKWGEVLTTLNGDKEMVELNTPKDAIYVDDVLPVSNRDYWDGKRFISIGESPFPKHVFDYSTKQWVDPRTLDEYKIQKWDEIKLERDSLEFGVFEFEGNTYDSDQVSQGRIMGAALAGIDQVWTTADNSIISLTGSELLDLYQALQAHVASVHERGRIARAAITAATTKEEVEEIHL